MDFEMTPRAAEWRDRLWSFFNREVLPRHREWTRHVVELDEPAPFMPARSSAARS